MAAGFRALVALTCAGLIGISLSSKNVSAEEAVMSAEVGGRPWTASFTMAQTLQLAGKPVLNLSGTEQGSPTTTFNSMLMLKDAGDPVGSYPLNGGFPANSANLNILDSGILTGRIHLSAGEVVIERYDAASKTISGHFAGSGKDESGRPMEISGGKFSGIPLTAQ